MKRLHTETRGIEDWRMRLAKPNTQWVREKSAFEAAVCWELAGRSKFGLPAKLSNLLTLAGYGDPKLLIGVAEHKVPLEGQGGDSQCDFWGLLRTNTGQVSLSVEAKADEPFGTGSESLADWLKGGSSTNSGPNRQKRWKHVERMLPPPVGPGYDNVAFQILHRCASAVIEADRFGISHAVFLVQAFRSPEPSYNEFKKFCTAIGVTPSRGKLLITKVGTINLGVAWIDFPLATDAQLLRLNTPVVEEPLPI